MKPYGLKPKKCHIVGCCPGHDELGANKFSGAYKGKGPGSRRKNRFYRIAKKAIRKSFKLRLRKGNYEEDKL